MVRHIAGGLALLLGAYCLIAAATALYADTAPDQPNPAELAARQRYQWPNWIPVAFLVLVVLYALVIGARRRRRRRDLSSPSTQGPPLAPPASRDRSRHDTASR